jgi:hypothetical protein
MTSAARYFSRSFFCLLVLSVRLVVAQELEPRRWTHLPIGSSFAAAGYSHVDANIQFDPALQIEDATEDAHVLGVGYIRVFDVFGKTGRIQMQLNHSNARWEGLLEGDPASTERHGFNDPSVRFAVNLVGSPAQRGAAFREFKVTTIIGAGLEIKAPLGEYKQDKLINLGTNRWTIKPELGAVHHWGKWSAEVTTSIWFFTDNDDFRGDAKREQAPLYAVQGHLIHTFRPGLWVSLSGAYGDGARSKIDGIKVDDRTQKSLFAFSLGLPISPRQGVKFAYVRGDTHADTGDNSDQLIIVYSRMWGGQ